MESKRLILFVIFSFALLLLWDSWQQKQIQNELAVTNSQLSENQANVFDSLDAVSIKPSYQLETDSKVVVNTPLYQAEINTIGGDIRKLKLVKFKNDTKDGLYDLFHDEMNPFLYIAQSGLIGKNLPSHKAIFKADQLIYEIQDIDTITIVPLVFDN